MVERTFEAFIRRLLMAGVVHQPSHDAYNKHEEKKNGINNKFESKDINITKTM